MTTDFNQKNSELAANLKEATTALGKYGVTWLGLDSSADALQHIKERHFSGGDVPGSKFLSSLPDEQIRYTILTGELAIVSGMVKNLQGGAKVSDGLRVEAEKDFNETLGNIGTDVLIKREAHEGGIVVYRNPDNERDVPVYLKLTDESLLPLTSRAMFIGGTYRPEDGKPQTAGFYTFFPGDNAPPMADTAFWDKHGFLATKNEMNALIGKLDRKGMTEEAEAVQRTIRDASLSTTRQQQNFPTPKP